MAESHAASFALARGEGVGTFGAGLEYWNRVARSATLELDLAGRELVDEFAVGGQKIQLWQCVRLAPGDGFENAVFDFAAGDCGAKKDGSIGSLICAY